VRLVLKTTDAADMAIGIWGNRERWNREWRVFQTGGWEQRIGSTAVQISRSWKTKTASSACPVRTYSALGPMMAKAQLSCSALISLHGTCSPTTSLNRAESSGVRFFWILMR
jgi:hypothetical protein